MRKKPIAIPEEWRTDLENATAKNLLLLLDQDKIISGEWRPRADCWWIAGGGCVFPDQVRGWLPRTALPYAVKRERP